MGSGASSLPPVEGFGQNGNVAIDRSSRLDLPWKLALTEIGSDVDVETLQKMADSCSDQELHCCRAFFRAFRALPLSEMDETEQELCKQMYFVTAHSPKSLLVFYSILHQCALLKIDSLEPIPEAASLFVQTCLDTYTTEKGFENALQVEHIKVDAMRGIVCSYLEELLDVLTNAALAEPCMEMVDGIPVYTLEADPIEVRVGAQGGDLLRLRVNGKDIFLQDEKSETRKDIFRCASAPENSSLCNQVQKRRKKEKEKKEKKEKKERKNKQTIFNLQF